MTSTSHFPQSLLTTSVTERLRYFEQKIVAHPRLKEVYHTLLQAIDQPTGGSLIFVFGPTGVGKTTLRLRAEQHLTETALVELSRDPGRIPVARVEAIAPELGQFNWKDYYKRALASLDEPLIADKVDYGVQGIHRDNEGRLVFRYTLANSELRRALEQCLLHRRPTALIVDEAQHFKKVSRGRRLLDQMDALKSLASVTGTMHVLVGTYELLDLTNLSAQLSRRSIDIHFPRYRPDRPGDVEAFKSVLLTFQRHLPLTEEPDLVSLYDYLYEGSVGCVGVLKEWLNRALAAALREEQVTLPLSYLQKTAEPARNLLRMAREIKEGEEALLEVHEQRTELRALLGLDPLEAGTNDNGHLTAPMAKQRRRVGERKPVRDVVGVDQ